MIIMISIIFLPIPLEHIKKDKISPTVFMFLPLTLPSSHIYIYKYLDGECRKTIELLIESEEGRTHPWYTIGSEEEGMQRTVLHAGLRKGQETSR